MNDKIEAQATTKTGLWGWGGNNTVLADFYINGGPVIKFPALIEYKTDLQSTTFTKITKGYPTTHALTIKSDGTLWAWGRNIFGQLGVRNKLEYSVPTQVGNDTNWQAAYTGSDRTFAIKTDGTLWAWGRAAGALTASLNTDRSSPVQLFDGTNWSSMDVDIYYAMAIKTDGTLWGWGFNLQGGIGGAYSTTSSPVQIGTDTNWSQVSIGNSTTLALKTDGTLWAWGRGDEGKFGDGVLYTGVNSSPTQIGTSTSWDSVSVGFYHCLGVKSDGTLWSWGKGLYGNLGRGSTSDNYTATQIGTATNWSKAFAWNNSFAIKTDGTLWAWGLNNGQLGLGSDITYNTSSPMQVGTYLDGNWIDIHQAAVNTVALANLVEPCCLFSTDNGYVNPAENYGTFYQLGGCWNSGDNYENVVYGVHVGTYQFIISSTNYPRDALAFLNAGKEDAIEYTGTDYIGDYVAPDGNTYPYYGGIVTLTIKKSFDYAISFHNFGRVATNNYATNQENGIRYYEMCIPIIVPTPTPTPTPTAAPLPPSWSLFIPVDPNKWFDINLWSPGPNSSGGTDGYAFYSTNYTNTNNSYSVMAHMTYGSPRWVTAEIMNYSDYEIIFRSYFLPSFDVTIPVNSSVTYSGLLQDGEYVALINPNGTYNTNEVLMIIKAFPPPTPTPTPTATSAILPTPTPTATTAPISIELTSSTNLTVSSTAPIIDGYSFTNTAVTGGIFSSTFTYINTYPYTVVIDLTNNSSQNITININGTIYTVYPGQTFNKKQVLYFGQTVTITGASGNYAAGDVTGAIYVLPKITPVPAGGQFYIEIMSPDIVQTNVVAYAYDKKAKFNPWTRDESKIWNLYEFEQSASYYITNTSKEERYGPYFSGARDQLTNEVLGVVINLQYIRTGYGITDAWLPIEEYETGLLKNLKFFGINKWYFE